MATEIVNIDAIMLAINEADTPEKIVDVENKIVAAEEYMKRSGLYPQMRALNEARMRARWKLGQILAKVERSKGGRGNSAPGVTSFLKTLGLGKKPANEAQKLAALPADKLEQVLAESRKSDAMNTFESLIAIARPFWSKANRQKKHKDIAEKAGAKKSVVIETNGKGESHFADGMGPFALIYADPPWQFDTWGENGKQKSADNHYQTLPDDEIIGHLVQGKTVPEITNEKAVLFMWCTASNMERALRVVKCWGFDYKTNFVWVKDRPGTGYYSLCQHELLLLATHGGGLAPQWRPRSVFAYPITEHSAKPPEIREAIERMYPDFNEKTRLEMFSRSAPAGWSVWGLEAGRSLPDDLPKPSHAVA